MTETMAQQKNQTLINQLCGNKKKCTWFNEQIEWKCWWRTRAPMIYDSSNLRTNSMKVYVWTKCLHLTWYWVVWRKNQKLHLQLLLLRWWLIWRVFFFLQIISWSSSCVDHYAFVYSFISIFFHTHSLVFMVI